MLHAALLTSKATEHESRVPVAHRNSALTALRLNSSSLRTAVASVDPRLMTLTVGSIPDVQYIPDWLDPAQEQELMRLADSNMMSWEHMKTRSTQEWGAGDRCACGRGFWLN